VSRLIIPITKLCLAAGFLLLPLCSHGQDQRVADSLAILYRQPNLPDSTRAELLRSLAFNEVKDLKLALHYAEALITLASKTNNPLYLHRGYLQKGNKKRLTGDLDEALAAYFKSVDAASRARYVPGEGITYNAIADVYSISGNHDNAMLYYHKAIATLQPTNDLVSLGSAISNAGDEFLTRKMYDSALHYFKQSGPLFDKANYQPGKAYNLGNMGMVYANIGDNSLAEKNINEATQLLEQLQDYYPICVYLLSMCDIYTEKGQHSTALGYASRSLALAQQHGLKDQLSAAHQKLYQLYEKAGQPANALLHYKAHISYRDSVNNIQSVQKMADLRTNFEVAKKQTEVDLLNQEKRNQRIMVFATIAALLFILVLAILLYRRYQFIKKTNRIIDAEKMRSDNLLLNILPQEIAAEIKQHGRVQAKRFEQATVMFTDFKGFTQYATHLPPEKLVESIDFYFARFDAIMEKYGLEKIKTVGDAYMCAGGLPFAAPGHALQVIAAAKEIAAFVQHAKENAAPGETRFDVRIGINTGAVVAGVVGTKKFAYDIWGDTVNIASRMESNSLPGRINLSENTWQLVKDSIPCEYRGEIDVKNRGLLKMYFVL
jgi:adenylate cyclase